MFKVVWLGKLKQGMDRDASWTHLRDVHAPLVRAVPQVDAYVQSFATSVLTHRSIGAGFEPGPEDPPLGFDFYSAIWYRDEAAFRDSLRTDEWASASADAADVLDLESFGGNSSVVDARTIIDGGFGPLKTVYVMRFKEEIASDPQRTREAHEYWIQTHGHRFGVAVPGISRYVQNHVVAPLGADGTDDSIPMAICGLSECWFEDAAAHELAMASPEWLTMNKDAENLFDTAWSMAGMCAVIEENVVLDS